MFKEKSQKSIPPPFFTVKILEIPLERITLLIWSLTEKGVGGWPEICMENLWQNGEGSENCFSCKKRSRTPPCLVTKLQSPSPLNDGRHLWTAPYVLRPHRSIIVMGTLGAIHSILLRNALQGVWDFVVWNFSLENLWQRERGFKNSFLRYVISERPLTNERHFNLIQTRGIFIIRNQRSS